MILRNIYSIISRIIKISDVILQIIFVNCTSKDLETLIIISLNKNTKPHKKYIITIYNPIFTNFHKMNDQCTYFLKKKKRKEKYQILFIPFIEKKEFSIYKSQLLKILRFLSTISK